MCKKISRIQHNPLIPYRNEVYYVCYLNRFLSADTIVPDPSNPQSYNRYTYALNNPFRYIDPTGHCSFDVNGNIDRFDCSLDEFDAMPIAERERWMRQFMDQVPGAANWFNNIVGIIEGFVEYGLADPGSWLSVVDAGILQGIQDGYTLSEGTATYSTNNPGSLLWKDFFDILESTEHDDIERIKRWGAAEQAATDYGIGVATSRNLLPNGYEWAFLLTGNIYRGAASAFDGGLGIPVSFLTAALGGLSGVDGDLSVDAGYMLGSFFNDPRSLWNGHSPVYWYSTTLIWANQETHRWP